MENLVDYVQSEFVTKNDVPEFSAGDTITVYFEIREGKKTRTQFFRGVVIQKRGSGSSETFTIRKMSGTIGVERIFPVNLPAIQKIEVNKKVKLEEPESTTLETLQVRKLKSKRKEFNYNLQKFKASASKDTEAFFMNKS